MALNRYAKKCRHKYEMKKSHALRAGYYSVRNNEAHDRYWNDQCEGSKWYDERNDGYLYWRNWYNSGSRRLAKECTNSTIRSRYRELISNGELGDIIAMKGSDYEKEFDYYWAIW